jgi:hypothetical protein
LLRLQFGLAWPAAFAPRRLGRWREKFFQAAEADERSPDARNADGF